MEVHALTKKALSLGAVDLKKSTRKAKKYMVLYNDNWIHFGSKTGKTFLDHGDSKKQKAWYARHSKIKNKDGKNVIKIKTTPSFWSHQILWV
tara:strand:+ start:10472 stop:10747 length:276 start_codon:yes stop_codon:yes gene_type:complete